MVLSTDWNVLFFFVFFSRKAGFLASYSNPRFLLCRYWMILAMVKQYPNGIVRLCVGISGCCFKKMVIHLPISRFPRSIYSGVPLLLDIEKVREAEIVCDHT